MCRRSSVSLGKRSDEGIPPPQLASSPCSPQRHGWNADASWRLSFAILLSGTMPPLMRPTKTDRHRMSLVFIGDIHQNWHDVEAGLAALPTPPKAAVLLGDIECAQPLDTVAAPLFHHGVEVFWIHGNHDYDTGPEMWANLADPARNPLTSAGALHMRVIEIAGVRVAGLGGAFLPHVWPANAAPRLHRREQLAANLAVSRPDLDAPQAAALRNFLATTAIWPEDVDALSMQ